MAAPGQQMSPMAIQMQAQILADQTLLGRFMTAYNEGKMPPDQAAAWGQLMKAASMHTAGSAMGNGSAAPFPGNGGLTPQPTGTASRQPSHQGQPLPQWSNVPSALPPAATGAVPGTLDDHMKTVTEYTQQRSKALSLSSYLNRGDLSNEQRAMAQTNLDRVKVSLDALGKRLQQIMAADPTAAAAIKTHLAASQAAGQQAAMAAAAAGAAGGAADPSSNFQMQQQQLMRARNQGLARGPAPAAGGKQAPPRAATPAQSQGGAAPSIVQSSHSMGLPPVNPNVPKDLISEARPEPFANVGRPTLNQGLASQPSVGSPAIVQAPPSHPSTGLPGAGPGHGGMGGYGTGLGSNAGPDPYASRALNKRKLADLVASIDPLERLEPEVEELLLEVADEFIESVTKASCRLAQHRKADRLETRDIQLHLEHVWNMRIPGFSADDVRVSQNRRLNIPPSHSARLGIARDTARRRG